MVNNSFQNIKIYNNIVIVVVGVVDRWKTPLKSLKIKEKWMNRVFI